MDELKKRAKLAGVSSSFGGPKPELVALVVKAVKAAKAPLLPEGRIGKGICRRRINGALAHKTTYRYAER